MKIITLEKYLDTPTTSCDESSNVHDCYILLPSKIHKYLESQENGNIELIDVSTKQIFSMQLSKGREYRINQFREYINNKKITMGDKITISLIQNENKNIQFFIDTTHNNFFKLDNVENHIYNAYLKDAFLALFDSNSKITLQLDDNTDLEVEKIGNQFKIMSQTSKKFLLNENENEKYSIIKLPNPSVLDEDSIIIKDNPNEIVDRKFLFTEHIKSDPSCSKLPSRSIKYLDSILPQKINENNPQSIFEIDNIDELLSIQKKLKSGGEYHSWDRMGSYAGEILQVLNKYIDFFKKLTTKSIKKKDLTSEPISEESKTFHSFIEKIVIPTEKIKLNNVNSNIIFNIGQPNTGKSYNFEEFQIFNKSDIKKYKYLKIPVSGGIGNEYKGLQNTDLAITYDPIKKELKFGEFLQVLMSAIVNPSIPHIIFLDDFHNQDISSLLSEYTPLFKAQQKREIPQVDEKNAVYNKKYSDINEFINTWNDFILTHCSDTPIVPLTNRISGKSLNLVYPSNFYLLGAANFNENTLNIFADWEDRAKITYKNPIDTFNYSLNTEDLLDDNNVQFLECCKLLNKNLKEILESKNIFDYDRYCFGMWKIVKSDNMIVNDKAEQIKIIKFFFGMIKNSLKFNNKNSYINEIAWDLMIKMQDNDWFKDKIESISNKLDINYKILHKYNIYEDDI